MSGELHAQILFNAHARSRRTSGYPEIHGLRPIEAVVVARANNEEPLENSGGVSRLPRGNVRYSDLVNRLSSTKPTNIHIWSISFAISSKMADGFDRSRHSLFALSSCPVSRSQAQYTIDLMGDTGGIRRLAPGWQKT